MKKHVMLAICVMLFAFAALSACSSGSSNTSEPKPDSGNSPSTSAPAPANENEVVELSIFAPPKSTIDVTDNAFTKHVEEKLNVKIQWEIAPTQGQKQRKNLLFASGDYTDVFLHGNHAEEGLTRTEQMQLGSQGILIPLNDLIEQHAPNIRQALDELPFLRPGITAPDGNIYALPEVNICFHCDYQQKMWINTKWLSNLGLSMPTTTEEFYQVLKAFKEQDANGNGDPNDEIPMSAATNAWRSNVEGFLMNAFIYTNTDHYLVVDSGNVGLAASDPKWQEGLRYLNKLYSEGLIDPAAFTQNRDALFQLGTVPGDYAILGAVPGGFYGDFVDRETERNKEYDTVPPLVGPDGTQYATFYGGVGDGFFAITNKATEAEAVKAIQLADYLYTEEGAVLAEYGEITDDSLIVKAAAGEIGLDGGPAKYKRNPDVLDADDYLSKRAWSQLGPRYVPGGMNWLAPADKYSLEGTELRLLDETKKYAGKEAKEIVPAALFIPDEFQDEHGQLMAQIEAYLKENLVQFITGSKHIDNDWDAYVKGLQDLSLGRYLEIVQAAYDASQAK